VLTISVGLAASHPGHRVPSSTLVAEADTALYEAKTTGRDRIALAATLAAQPTTPLGRPPPWATDGTTAYQGEATAPDFSAVREPPIPTAKQPHRHGRHRADRPAAGHPRDSVNKKVKIIQNCF